jgi:hypothetical protein
MCQQTVVSVGRHKLISCIELAKGKSDKLQAYVISVRECERKDSSVTVLLLGGQC